MTRHIHLLSLLPMAVFLALFFYAPFIILFYESFLGYGGELTLENYLVLATDPAYRKVIVYSFIISLETVAATLLLSFPAAYYVAKQAPSRERNLLLLLFLTPFWIDVLLRALAIKSIVYALGGAEGYPAMMLGMVYEYLPFMFFPLYVNLSRLPVSVVEAARVMGASRLQVLRSVIIPLSLPGIVAGSLLVGLMSMTEYVIPALLGGVKGFMVGTLIYYLFLSGGMWGVGAALTIILVLVLMTASYLVAKRTGEVIEY